MIYLVWYKVPLWDGIDLISRGCRKSKMGNTGVPTICTGLSFSTDCAAAVCVVYLV